MENEEKINEKKEKRDLGCYQKYLKQLKQKLYL